MNNEKLYTLPELSRLIGQPYHTVYQQCERGELKPALIVGKNRLFTASQVPEIKSWFKNWTKYQRHNNLTLDEIRKLVAE